MASGHWRRYRPRYFYPYQWPHLTSLYSSTSRLDSGHDNRNGKNYSATIGYDNVVDATEPYGAYKFYLAPREEFVIGSDPTLYHRQFKNDDDDRTSGYTNSYKDENNCRVFLCAFLILSFIGVIVAAVTLGVLLSYHRHIPDPTTTTTAAPGQLDNYQHALVLRNRTFTSDLSDPTSQAFNDTAKDFCSKIDAIYTSTDSPIKDSYVRCEVIKFTNGSIGVQYRIIVRKTSQTAQVQPEDLKTHLINTISKPGVWSDYDIDPNITVFVEESTITTQSATDIPTTNQTSPTSSDIATSDITPSPSTTTRSSSTTSVYVTTQEASTSDASISIDDSSTITFASTSTEKTTPDTNSIVVDTTALLSSVTTSSRDFSSMSDVSSATADVDRTSVATTTDFASVDTTTLAVSSPPVVTDTSMLETLSSSLDSLYSAATDTTSITISSSPSFGMTDSMTVAISPSSQYVSSPMTSESKSESLAVSDSFTIDASLSSQYIDSLKVSGSTSVSLGMTDSMTIAISPSSQYVSSPMTSESKSESLVMSDSLTIDASLSSQYMDSPMVSGSTSTSLGMTDSTTIAASLSTQYTDSPMVSGSTSTSLGMTDSTTIAASLSTQYTDSPMVSGSTATSLGKTDSMSIAASLSTQYMDSPMVSGSTATSLGKTDSTTIAASLSSQYSDLPMVSDSTATSLGKTDSMSIPASLSSQYVNSPMESGSTSPIMTDSITIAASLSSKYLDSPMESVSTSLAVSDSLTIAASSSSQYIDSVTMQTSYSGSGSSFLSSSTSFSIIDSSTAHLSSIFSSSADSSSVSDYTYLTTTLSTSIMASLKSIYNDSSVSLASSMDSVNASKSQTQFESSSISTFSSLTFDDSLISSASVTHSLAIDSSKSEYSDQLSSLISSSPAVFDSSVFSLEPSSVYSSTANLPLPSVLNDIDISASLYSKVNDYSALSSAFIDTSTISSMSFTVGIDTESLSSLGSMTPTFDGTPIYSSSVQSSFPMSEQSGIGSLTVTTPVSYSYLGTSTLGISSLENPKSTPSINSISTNLIGDSTTIISSGLSFTNNALSSSVMDSPRISSSELYGTTVLSISSTPVFLSSSEYASKTSSNVFTSRLNSLEISSVTPSIQLGILSSEENLMSSYLESTSATESIVSTFTHPGVLISDSTLTTMVPVSISSVVPSTYTSIISSSPVNTVGSIQSAVLESPLYGSLSTSSSYSSLPVSSTTEVQIASSLESPLSSSVSNLSGILTSSTIPTTNLQTNGTSSILMGISSSQLYSSTPVVTPSLLELASMQATLTDLYSNDISANVSIMIATTPTESSVISQHTGFFPVDSLIAPSMDTSKDELSPTMASAGIEQTLFQTMTNSQFITTMLDNVSTANIPQISPSSSESVFDLTDITTSLNSDLLMNSLSNFETSMPLASSFSIYTNNFVSSHTPGGLISVASSNSQFAMESNSVSSSITN